MTYPALSAILVPNQGPPPDSFIKVLVCFGKIVGRYVAAVNSNQDDIMGVIRPIVAPGGWTGIEHRLAGLLVALLYDAGFESSWNWQEGMDPDGTGQTNPATAESGAWQVSQDSIGKDASLIYLVRGHCSGLCDPETFQAAMKADWMLAILYAAWLFRFNTKWSGPCDSGHLAAAMTGTDNGAAAIAAVSEMQALIAS